MQVFNKFLLQTIKNFNEMKKKFKTIWAAAFALLIITTTTSCNVTRTIKTESSYFQKGDTTCTITVKTVETYDATKKGI